MTLSDKISIGLAIAAFLFGSGFLLALWDRINLKKRLKSEKRLAKAERTLYGFLRPLKSLLDRNRKIHDDFASRFDLKSLEPAPDYIRQRIYQCTPDEQERKFWFSRLETLIENNDQAIELIQAHIGLLPDTDLSKSLGGYMSHAEAFSDIWRKIKSDDPLPPGLNPSAVLYADQYPLTLDRELVDEIVNCRKIINA